MYPNFRFLALFASVFILAKFSSAQLVSGNAFLKGNYLEVGIAQCGVFGSTAIAPFGYHVQGSNYLGFVADVDKDGWSNGTPNFCGDYFRPGTPEEGFSVEVNGINYGNFEICTEVDIPGAITNVNNTGATVSAGWQGSVAGLSIEQTTQFDTNTVFFSTTVVITNTTTSTLNNIYYMRNVDPDNEQPLTSNFNTTNEIILQNPNSQDLALVQATGLTYGCLLALGAKDPRAKVTHGGFDNRSASAVYNGTGLNSSGIATNIDQAISISFSLGDLSPGESTCLTFFYIFDQTEMSTALSSTSFECIDLSVQSAPSNICPEDSFAVTYLLDTSNIVPQIGNTFSVELSDSLGSFANPLVIGTLASLSSEDTIMCYVPISVAFGNQYRVRVVMDNPIEIGSDNGLDISVGSPQPLFGPATTSCTGDPAVLEVEPGAEFYIWSTGSNDNSITVNTSNVYSVTVVNGGCVDTFSTVVTSQVSPLLFLIDSVNACNTDSVEISAGVGYPQYLWSTGSTGSSAYAQSSGTYFCTVTGLNGCTAFDSTHVLSLDSRISTISDTVCAYDEVILTTPLYSECLHFLEFTNNNQTYEDIEFYINDDYGSIAVTPNYIYYTGDLATIRMDADDFGNKVQYLRREAIFSDLSTGDLYTFWNINTNSFTPSQITSIRSLDQNLSFQNTIFLNQTLSTLGFGNGIFAGEGFIIFYNRADLYFYHISLPDGQVTQLSYAPTFFSSLYSTEGWAAYGVAECSDNGYSVIFRNTSGNTISRHDITAGSTSTVTNFTQSIGDMACFTYSPWNESWYYQVESGSSILGLGSEVIGKAQASLGSLDYDYTWSTGDSSNSVVVSPLTTTSYAVTISHNGYSCSDSVTIHVKGVPFNIGSDTILACDSSASIVDAGVGFVDYEWSTGDTTQFITVSSQFEQLSVNVSDTVGCSIEKQFVYINANNLLDTDTLTYCADDTLLLTPKHLSSCNKISSITADNFQIAEFNTTFTNDAAGLVVTEGYVYYNTSSNTIRCNKDLTNPSVLPLRKGILVNLLNHQLLSFTDTATGFFSGNQANALYLLDENLGITDTMPLSQNINFGFYSGIFMGSGYIIAHSAVEDIFYKIDLFDGEVSFLSQVFYGFPFAEDFAVYGIAECNELGEYSILYSGNNSNYLYRYNVSTGVTDFETVSDQTLGLMESIAPSYADGRWYFHYEGVSNAFGFGSQRIGYADMNYRPIDLNYTWSNGEVNAIQRISAQEAANVSLEISIDGNSCTDTVSIDLLSSISLGLPDSIANCFDNTVTLGSASNAAITNYYWSNGDSTQTTIIDALGNYRAFAQDSLGCVHSEEVFVALLKAKIEASSPNNCDSSGVLLSVSSDNSCNSVSALSYENYATLDVYSTVIDDRGGIAVTPNYVYYCGDNATIRLTHNLDSATSLPVTDYMFYDLTTESVYKLGGSPFTNPSTIIKLKKDLSTDYAINLSQPLPGTGYTQALLASGSGFVIIGFRTATYNFNYYYVDIITGEVSVLGTNVFTPIVYPEGATISAVAQCTSEGYEILFRTYLNNNDIERLSFPSYNYSVFESLPSSLGDMDGFAISPWDNRWYGQYEGFHSLFGNGLHTMFYADAETEIGKSILWNTGETSRAIYVNPDSATQYTVQVAYQGLSCTDSITIDVATATAFNLPDTVIGCSLLVEVDAGSQYASYSWSNGDTTQITFSESNNSLIATVIDTNLCALSDTVKVIGRGLTIEAASSGICDGDSLELAIADVDVCLENVAFSKNDSAFLTLSVSFDDRTGIAITPDYLYVTSDFNTVRFDKELTTQTVLTFTEGIFSDLSTGQVYSLWDANLNSFFSFSVNALRLHDDNLGVQSTLSLSQNIGIGNSDNTIFAGAGFFILHSVTTDSVYHIELETGQVTNLGTINIDALTYDSEGFAEYGVAACATNGGYDLFFRSGFYDIRVMNTITTSSSSVFYSSSSFGDMPNITYSPWDQRWYFSFEGFSSAFGFGGSENVGYASASATLGALGDVLWSTGDTTLSIIVSPTAATTYSVDYTADGITCSDSITIEVSTPPILTLDSLYPGCSNAGINILLPAHNFYEWSTGDSTQSADINSSGAFWVRVSDTAGCWSSDTALAAIINSEIQTSDSSYCGTGNITLSARPSLENYRMLSLLNTNSTRTEVGSYTGDDNCGIAVTQKYAYVNGDNNTVRVYANDLSNPQVLPFNPTIFADPADGSLFKFWNVSLGSLSNNFDAIVQLDEDLIPIDTVMLGTSINVYYGNGWRNGVFPGPGFVILFSDWTNITYHIDLASGLVTALSSIDLTSNIYSGEGWAVYGIGEYYNGAFSVVFRSGASTFSRFDMSTVTTLSTLSSLGDITNIAYSPWLGRWYFSYESFAFPGSGSESVAFADALDFNLNSYLWSTGDTTRSISVSPTSTTTYSLSVSLAGDTCTDQVEIIVPTTITSLNLSDTIVTCGPSSVLTAGSGYSNHVWSTGGTGTTETINRSGYVYLTATDSFGCPRGDTSLVIQIDGSISGSSAYGCIGDSILYVFEDSSTSSCSFVSQWNANNPASLSVFSYIGDDNCGIAATPTGVYVNGDNACVKLDNDLNTSLGTYTQQWRYSIFADAGTGELYAFWSNVYNFFNASYINVVLKLDEGLNPIDTIFLSEVLTPGSGGVFPGSGYVIMQGSSTNQFFNIDLTSGQVTTLNTSTTNYTPYGAEGWAYYGFADCSAEGNVIYYRDNIGSNIESYVIETGVASTFQFYSNLGDAANFALSPWNNRWYGMSEFNTQFLGSSEHVFSGDIVMNNLLANSISWSNGDTGDSTYLLLTDTSNTITASVVSACNTCSTCSYSDSVSADSGLTITTIALTNNQCSEDLTGSGALSILENAPYSVIWSNGATTDTIDSLQGGTYFVTVTSFAGCVRTDSVVIQSPDPISIQKQVNPPSCPGDTNGSIQLMVSGPGNIFSFLWSTGSVTDGDSNLLSGNYSVTITDSAGCEFYRSYFIPNSTPVNSPNPITVSQNPICSGEQVVLSAFSGLGTGSTITTYSLSTPVQNTSTDGDTLYYEFVGMPNIFSSIAVLYGFYRGDLDNPNENVSYYGESNYFIGSSDSTAGCGNSYGAKSFNIPSTLFNQWNLDDTVRIMVVTTQDVNQCNPKYQGYLRFDYLQGSKTYWFENACEADPALAIDSASSLTLTPDSAFTIYAMNYSAGCWSTCDSATVNVLQNASVSLNYDTINLCDLSSVNLKAEGSDVFFWQPSTGLNLVLGDSVIASPSSDLTYTVYGQNASGCTDTGYVRVNVNESLYLSQQDIIAPSCYGFDDGSISVTVDGGNAPYAYAWSTGDTTTSIDTLSHGAYWLYALDTVGQCEDTFYLNVQEPDSLEVQFSVLNVLCAGDSNGSVSSIISGGTAPYNLAWSNGDTNILNANLAAGNYSVNIVDSLGCATSGLATVSEPNPLSLSTTSYSISCFGDSTGSLVVNAVGGTGPYSYAWSNGTSTDSITSLAAGTYSVTVTDAHGCTDSSSATIADGFLQTSSIAINNQVECLGDSTAALSISSNVTTPSYLWNTGDTSSAISGLPIGQYAVTTTGALGCITIDSIILVTAPGNFSLTIDSVSDASCYQVNDGFASVAIVGSGAPFSVQWSNGDSTSATSTLVAGTYTVTVGDSAQCTDTLQVTISEPAPIVFAVDSIRNIDCFGDSTGTAAVSLSGGTLPYTLSWSNGATGDSLNQVAAGSYVLSTADSLGCTRQDTVTLVNLHTGLIVSDSVINVDCAGDSTGAIYLSPSGGLTPYSFGWSNGGSNDSITGVVLGDYQYTVTDALGCVSSDSLTIIENNLITVSVSQLAQVICHDSAEASIAVSATGGLGTLGFAWNTGDTIDTLPNLTAGMYFITVTDSVGCSKLDSISVYNPTLLTLSVDSLRHLACFEDSSGYVQVTGSGGEGGLSYNWNTTSTLTSIDSLPQGNYSVTVTDTLGCSTDTLVTVNEPALLITNIATFSHLSCNGANDGVVNMQTVGGTAPYSYSWNGNAGIDYDSTLAVGAYLIQVTDGNGCTSSDSITLTQPSVLDIVLDSLSDVSCYQIADGSIGIHATGGTTPYSYAWNTSSPSTDSVINGLDTGMYIVTVTDQLGCVKIDSFTIDEPDSLELTWINNQNTSCYQNTASGLLEIAINGGIQPYQVNWSNGQDSTAATNLAAGLFTVTVTDFNGCLAVISDSVVRDTFPLASTAFLGDHCIEADSISLTGGLPLGGVYSGNAVTNGFFYPSIAGSGSHPVFYTYTDGNGCSDTSMTNIQIDSVPVVTLDSIPVACVNIGTLQLTQGSPSGGLYFGNGVSGSTFDPSIAGLGTHTIGYTIMTTGGCSDTATREVVVNVYPVLSYTDTNQLCGNHVPIMLQAGSPADGYHFGNGVNNGVFNPRLLSQGQDSAVIGYVYEHVCGTDSVYHSIALNPIPTPDLGQDADVCLNSSIEIQSAGRFSSYLWNTGSTTRSVITQGADISGIADTLSLTVTNDFNCSSSDTILVSVLDTQLLNLVDTFTCLDSALSLYAPAESDLLYTWSTGSTNADIVAYNGADTRPSKLAFQLEVENANGCTSRDSVFVSVIDCDTIRTPGFYRIYPNPSDGDFTIEVFLEKEQELNINILEITGRFVKREVHALPKGKSWIDIETADIGAGVMIIQFTMDGTVVAERLVLY